MHVSRTQATVGGGVEGGRGGRGEGGVGKGGGVLKEAHAYSPDFKLGPILYSRCKDQHISELKILHERLSYKPTVEML